MVLLDPLQKEGSIEAEFKHLLEARDVVVEERKPADPALHALGGVLIGGLGAKVIDLHHVAVIFLKEPHDVPPAIAVERLRALSWEAARDDAVGDVGHVQIKVVNLEPSLVSGDLFSDPVKVAAARGLCTGFGFFVLLGLFELLRPFFGGVGLVLNVLLV